MEVSEEEAKLLIRKYAVVKQAGYGKLVVTVQDGQIVYVEVTEGEQVKLPIE